MSELRKARFVIGSHASCTFILYFILESPWAPLPVCCPVYMTLTFTESFSRNESD